MDLREHGEGPGKKFVGITLVLLAHTLLIYAFLNGLGKQTTLAIKGLLLETTIIKEIRSPASPEKITPKKTPVSLLAVPARHAVSPEVIQTLIEMPTSPPETHAEITRELQVGDAAMTGSAKDSSVVDAVVDFSSCNKPTYPINSLRNEEQGTVRLQFLIDLNGQVADSKIVNSSGFRALDAAAKKALSLCRFEPGTIDGRPQQSWTVVSYVWKLPD
jgi:protein TonB